MRDSNKTGEPAEARPHSSRSVRRGRTRTSIQSAIWERWGYSTDVRGTQATDHRGRAEGDTRDNKQSATARNDKRRIKLHIIAGNDRHRRTKENRKQRGRHHGGSPEARQRDREDKERTEDHNGRDKRDRSRDTEQSQAA